MISSPLMDGNTCGLYLTMAHRTAPSRASITEIPVLRVVATRGGMGRKWTPPVCRAATSKHSSVPFQRRTSGTFPPRIPGPRSARRSELRPFPDDGNRRTICPPSHETALNPAASARSLTLI
jgi:hypothetical protein